MKTIRNIFIVQDLRNKLLFTLLMVAIYQLGANIPVPGVSFAKIEALAKQSNTGSGLGFPQLLFSGRCARSQAAVLGLGIMPYITASIIIQLLGTVIEARRVARAEVRSASASSPRPPAT